MRKIVRTQLPTVKDNGYWIPECYLKYSEGSVNTALKIMRRRLARLTLSLEENTIHNANMLKILPDRIAWLEYKQNEFKILKLIGDS